METAVAYIIKSAVVAAVLYIFMKILMERESLHGYIRFLWVASIALSLVIPLVVVDVGSAGRNIAGQMRALILPEVSVAGEAGNAEGENAGTAVQLMTVVYFAGMAAATILYIINFMKVRKILKGCSPADGRYEAVFETLRSGLGRQVRARLLLSDREVAPFSIFGKIVVSRRDADSAAFRDILLHELAHTVKGHSYDLAVSGLFTIFQWFNPCAWLIKSSLKQVHEYSADRFVLDSGTNIYEYQLLLIKKAVGQRFHSVANSLNHSNLKKRITMMGKNPKPGAVIKSLLALPVSAMLIASFSAMNSSAADKVTPSVPILQDTIEVVSYQECEVMPSFQGGDPSSFTRWMMGQLQFPEQAKNDSISGRVIIRFVISSEGKLTDAEIVKSPHKLLSEEVLRILSLSPDWTPGKIDGNNVNTSLMMPVVFSLEE